MNLRCALVGLVFAAIALPTAASHYLVLRPDESSRSYTLPPPHNSARLSSTEESLALWLDGQSLDLDHDWLRSFKGVHLDSAALAREPADDTTLYVLIECGSGRLVLVIGKDRQVEYRDEECHDI